MIRRSGVPSSRIQIFFVGCEAWIFCSRVTARKQIFCFLLVDNSWLFLLLCKRPKKKSDPFRGKKTRKKNWCSHCKKKSSRPLKIMMCFWLRQKVSVGSNRIYFGSTPDPGFQSPPQILTFLGWFGDPDPNCKPSFCMKNATSHIGKGVDPRYISLNPWKSKSKYIEKNFACPQVDHFL